MLPQILLTKQLCIEATKPFVILEKSLLGSVIPAGELEPEQIGFAERQKEPFGSLCPTRLPGRDKVRTWRRKMQRLARAIYDHFKQSDLRAISPSLSLN